MGKSMRCTLCIVNSFYNAFIGCKGLEIEILNSIEIIRFSLYYIRVTLWGFGMLCCIILGNLLEQGIFIWK